jgi:hypothetical protein
MAYSYIVRVDDSIAGVFTSKANAEKAIKWLNDEQGYGKFGEGDELEPYITKIETNTAFAV